MEKLDSKRKTKSHFPKRFLILILGILISVFEINAQDRAINGKVTANDGTGLPGASIIVKGTTRGTTTDSNGNFSILAGASNVLVVSYVGFITQEIPVNNQATINVTLDDNVNKLNEVIVTALGIKKETRTIGYAVQEISGDDLKKVRDANALNSLTGKIAGLTVSPSAEMLGSPKMILRGSSDVLIVIDGVPVNSDSYNINADDVESYTVLKGPNAAALYGFRGQNGALIITTKKASKDRVNIEFNSSTLFDIGFNSLPKVQEEYGIGENYLYAFGSQPTDGGSYTRANVWGPRLEGQPIAQWNSPINPVTGKRDSTAFVSHKGNLGKFLETGLYSSNNISISTNYERFTSRISAGQIYQKSMLPNSRLNITNVNIYTGYKASKKLNIEAGLNYNRQYSPNIPDVYYGPNSFMYMFGVYGSSHWNVDDMKDYWMPGQEGVQQKFAEYGRANNPYFLSNEWLREHYKNDIYGYTRLNYEISKDLSLSLRTQVTTWDMLRTEKVPYSANKYGRETEKKGDYQEDRRGTFENNSDIMLNYNKNISKSLFFSGLAGASVRSFKYNSTWQTTDYLVIPGVYNFSNSLYPSRLYSYKADMQVYSAYYSFDLSVLNFVTLSTTGRIDKLSTLPSDNNTFFYPSVTLSSMISDIVKMPSFVNSIKVRASYANVKGALTRPTIGPAYDAMGFNHPYSSRPDLTTSYNGPTYKNQDTYITTSLYNNEPSVSLSPTMANASLNPYSVTSYEGGLETNFFDNRIGIDFTYFYTLNGPQIFAKTAPASTGYNYQLINGVVTKKDGYELTLRLVPVFNKTGMRWQVNLNVSNYRETLQEATDGEDGISLNGHYYKIGERMDGIFGTKYNRDKEGNIIFDAGGMPLYSPKGDEHNKLLGFANPDYVWGISSNFTYKNLSFSLQFDGRVGGTIFNELNARQFQSGNSPKLVSGQYGEARLNEWESYKNTGSIEPSLVGQGVKIASGTPKFENGYITNMDEELTFVPNDKAVRLQSYTQSVYTNNMEEFMVDKTYTKLREVAVGYTFQTKLFSGKPQQITVSLVGRNLLYFSKVDNMDMDQWAEGYNAAETRIDSRPAVRLQSPTTRQIGFNLNVNF